MIKLKLKVLLDSQNNLTLLCKEKFKAKVGFLLADLIREIKVPLENYNQQRNNKIKEYGKLNEKNIPELKPDSENFDKFKNEILELLEVEVSLNIEKIPRDLFLDYEIDIALLYQLDWIFDKGDKDAIN